MALHQSGSKPPTDSDADAVRIWVRGHYMELHPDFVQSSDWVLAKALTSDVPWSRDPAGALLVDCDPEAFRSVVELLKGTATLQQFSRNLSELHHELMAITCEYLCCADLAKAFRSSNEQLCVLKKREQDAINRAKDAINRAEDAESKLIQMREEMNAPLVGKKVLAFKLTCESFDCGRIIMTTSPGGEALSDLECGGCKRRNYLTMEVLESFQEVKQCIEAIARQNKTISEVNIGKSAATAFLKKHKLPFKVA